MMDFDTSMRISASGMSANRVTMNVLASNLANINTTKTEAGKPYERRNVIYESLAVEDTFDGAMEMALEEGAEEVRVVDVVSDGREPKKVHDPNHPDADGQGYVLYPNISSIEEMSNLVSASRSYEANLAALQMAKQLAIKALEIGR